MKNVEILMEKSTACK